ncbi:metallophosphoesterase family protein [Sporolactobacillus spathodeae]|uniref:Phosphoesterase n=1 Tax=Sporolactobacillus spathodeae TaxID=1465502 RepID=A0ABS2Q8Q9_9BACL|nr:metallophosphoesterase [Sporolactobacillus spathodeae]MBM7658036.1 putative phosphoesterase [Sporolactobacillus spathodeae]
MKHLIVSDTHGWKKEVANLRDRYADAVDGCIHCGDSELPANSPEMAGFVAVEGNCDRPAAYPDERFVSIGALHILVAHGHLAGVRYSPDNLIFRAKELGAQIVCHGHTHFAGALKKDGVIVINPGSLRLPRNYFEGTYAVLETTNGAVSIRYFNQKGEAVDRFAADFPIG